MSSVASVRTSRLLVSKVFLAEFSISPTTSAVITTKRLATSLTTLLVSSCRCSESSLVLLKSPRRAAPIMDRKASTATTNSLIFSPYMSLKFATVLPASIGTTAANASNRPRRLGFIDETCTESTRWALVAAAFQAAARPCFTCRLTRRPQSNRAGLQQIEGVPAQGCAHASLLVFVLVIPSRPLPNWCACRPKENKQTGATALKEARNHAEQMSDETSRQTMLRIAVVAMPFRSSRETRTGRARRGLARSRGRRGRRCSACLFSSTCR